ncbi:hypothetical protein DH09_21825 [Bacillaceae bacterium JMAK1]|nr:hypothetical protein DH09_21825 [Bacillaceae bacterium JMAK1]
MMNTKSTPLLDHLVHHADTDPISLHVPGHKNGKLPKGIYQEYYETIMRLDQTELPGFDDLHAPSGVIQQAEKLTAEHYQTGASMFLVGGSTVGNLAMLSAFCRPSVPVIVQRDVHQSIIHGLEMIGVEVVFVSPTFDEQTGLSKGVSLHTLVSAIDAYKEAEVIVLSSPSYFGNVGEIQRVVQYAKMNDKRVLVDEAHGAHLHSDEQFPLSSLEAGADVVVQSAHKTLPALTMGAYLHVKNKDDEQRIRPWLRRFQSSSPSYVIMASLDAARAYVAEVRSNEPAKRLWAFHDELKARLPKDTYVPNEDPLKLVLRAPEPYTGLQWEKVLQKQQIYVELSNHDYVLLFLPLLLEDEEAIDLKTRIVDAYAGQRVMIKKRQLPHYPAYTRATIEKAFLVDYEVELCSMETSAGKVIAENIVPYPPGIPLFIAGETIDVRRLHYLSEWMAQGGKLQNEEHVRNGQVLVRKSR